MSILARDEQRLKEGLILFDALYARLRADQTVPEPKAVL
jgi:hypothetical protein